MLGVQEFGRVLGPLAARNEFEMRKLGPIGQGAVLGRAADQEFAEPGLRRRGRLRLRCWFGRRKSPSTMSTL